MTKEEIIKKGKELGYSDKDIRDIISDLDEMVKEGCDMAYDLFEFDDIIIN